MTAVQKLSTRIVPISQRLTPKVNYEPANYLYLNEGMHLPKFELKMRNPEPYFKDTEIISEKTMTKATNIDYLF